MLSGLALIIAGIVVLSVFSRSIIHSPLSAVKPENIVRASEIAAGKSVKKLWCVQRDGEHYRDGDGFSVRTLSFLSKPGTDDQPFFAS